MLLCLHTPRADCNGNGSPRQPARKSLPPHAPCRLQLKRMTSTIATTSFASTRPVQIATKKQWLKLFIGYLCLHTPRADCNVQGGLTDTQVVLCLHTPRADCNKVAGQDVESVPLCLHTPRADCNAAVLSECHSLRTLPPHAPCRLQRQKCTELQYALFRTCVESVDSFSVLNKAMLR